jgi:hypothetical protein
VPRVLVVTADIPAAAAVCAALHGEYVTVCDTVENALREIGAATEPFDVVLCEASLAIIELVVRATRQDPPARVAFLATASSDAEVAASLGGDGAVVVSPGDEPRLRAFILDE